MKIHLYGQYFILYKDGSYNINQKLLLGDGFIHHSIGDYVYVVLGSQSQIFIHSLPLNVVLF